MMQYLRIKAARHDAGAPLEFEDICQVLAKPVACEIKPIPLKVNAEGNQVLEDPEQFRSTNVEFFVCFGDFVLFRRTSNPGFDVAKLVRLIGRSETTKACNFMSNILGELCAIEHIARYFRVN